MGRILTILNARRLVNLISSIAGLALSLIIALIIFSGGKLLRGTEWAHALVIAAAIWIVSFGCGAFLDVRRSRALSRSQSSEIHTTKAAPQPSRPVVMALGIMSAIVFVLALVLLVTSAHTHYWQVIVLIIVGFVLLFSGRTAKKRRTNN